MSSLSFNALSLSLRGRIVLDAVSGQMAAGQVTVIMGPNGAGKSSLLSCLAGLRHGDGAAGRDAVRLDGRALSSFAAEERARTIGLLPQSAEIHWDVSVRALVALGRLPHHQRWGELAADRAAIDRAMAATDVTHLADRTVLRLSGGEQARVLLARVLAGEPRWLLADEPLANLDPAHQIDSLNRLRECARGGVGVVAVLHDLTQAARIADQVILMQSGRIVAAGPRDAVLTADRIEQIFGVRVYCGRDDNGAPVIIPIGHRSASAGLGGESRA